MSPEVAHVGMYESDARERGLEVDTLTLQLADVDRAVLDGADEGFLRLHIQKGKDRILGATLVAPHAGDMLGELSLAVTAGVGLNAIAGVIHPYPTQAEVIKKAADTWRRGKLTPAVKKEPLDRFYVKMKTPVDPDPEADKQAIEASYADPARFDDKRLVKAFGLEFQKFSVEDLVGFVICFLICFALIWLTIVLANLGA